MTTEEKARAYDEAIERAKELMNRGYYVLMPEIFPELQSEDERIRKSIIAIINNYVDNSNTFKPKMLGWLEKQGEDKHLELKAGKWYICYRAYCCRADHLTVKEGERILCEKDGVVKGFVIKDAEKYFKECNAPAPYEDEQKPKWTEENEDSNVNDETNAPTEYGKYVDECLNEASKHFFSEGEDKYSVADLFYAGVRCGKSWLKKQGEQKSVDDLTQQEAMDIAVAKCFEQNEQNPVDNIEPKFHKGEWITSEESVWQVDEVKTENYLLIDSEGILFAEEIATIDSEFHLWTIQDAKDGDVLARNSDILSICIFGHFDGISNKFSSFLCHCGLEGDGLAQELSINGYYDDSQDYVPATKEQRDLLFVKMKEAGYKWNADKKEIRKIDQNIGWGEEDEKMVKDIIAAIDTLYYHGMVNWLKHLKDRVQPQNIWHDASEKLPTGVIVVNCGGNLYIGWSTNEGDGIEDEHGHLITKTYQKWAREKDLI